jgi:hypothetical protein
MINFCQWIHESKEKSKNNKRKREPEPPTVVSAPIRGPNQDQSGFSPNKNTSDYTISD